MSVEREAQIGAAAHPEILKLHGGAYSDGALEAYVAGVATRIAGAAGAEIAPYRVTVLNSPSINAFVSPGGYLYLTRGLMSLANDEAELASVIGHEIGHVAERHLAQRHAAAVVLGAIDGSGVAGEEMELGGRGLLASYSRDQEYEADRLGIRYLADAGYDPYAASDFLKRLSAKDALEAKLRPFPQDDDPESWAASHPSTPERIEAAFGHARETGIRPGAGARNRDAYLSAIENMLYGDDPVRSVVRGNSFVHPVLRVAFEAPPGFVIVNLPAQVLVQGPERTTAKFDIVEKPAGLEIGDYLAHIWAIGIRIGNLERFTINGMQAATAPAAIGKYNGRLVAIEISPGNAGRFILGTLPDTGQRYAPALQELVMSFRRIPAEEANAVKPLRIRIVTARQGDTVASLARLMIYSDHQAERFRVLNGLSTGEGVVAGTRYKIISE